MERISRRQQRINDALANERRVIEGTDVPQEPTETLEEEPATPVASEEPVVATTETIIETPQTGAEDVLAEEATQTPSEPITPPVNENLINAREQARLRREKNIQDYLTAYDSHADRAMYRPRRIAEMFNRQREMYGLAPRISRSERKFDEEHGISKTMREALSAYDRGEITDDELQNIQSTIAGRGFGGTVTGSALSRSADRAITANTMEDVARDIDGLLNADSDIANLSFDKLPQSESRSINAQRRQAFNQIKQALLQDYNERMGLDTGRLSAEASMRSADASMMGSQANVTQQQNVARTQMFGDEFISGRELPAGFTRDGNVATDPITGARYNLRRADIVQPDGTRVTEYAWARDLAHDENQRLSLVEDTKNRLAQLQGGADRTSRAHEMLNAITGAEQTAVNALRALFGNEEQSIINAILQNGNIEQARRAMASQQLATSEQIERALEDVYSARERTRDAVSIVSELLEDLRPTREPEQPAQPREMTQEIYNNLTREEKLNYVNSRLADNTISDAQRRALEQVRDNLMR